MKIVFVVIGVESLAVELLSGFLKKHGYEVEVIFDPRLFLSEAIQVKKIATLFDTSREIVQQIIEKKPDLIGFSVFTLNYQRALELAKKLKQHNTQIPIIFGGIHPTSVPEVVIKEKCVDIVCVGEGEEALLELLDSFKNKRQRVDIKNLWFKRNGEIVKNPCRPLIGDLDSLPFPDKDIFYNIYPGFMKDYYTISSRGCPFACTYCANNVLRSTYSGLGKSIRRRSPENIIKELVWAKERYVSKKITFVDDVFVQDTDWLERFVSEYKKKVNLPYVMLTHPRFVTPEIVKLLVNSGCYLLAFGIQSASEKTRVEILKRFETNKEIEEATKNCHKVGLKFSVDHIFNIPGEGIREHEEALRFYNQIRPSIINTYWLQYFPKTEIINTAIEKGAIKESMVREIEEGLTSTSLVVGFGSKDSFNPELVYTNFQFFFMLLPILPKWLVGQIIKRKLYLLRFKPPMMINIGIKFFINLIRNRGDVYTRIIKSMLYFARANILLKWKYRKAFSSKYA